MTYIEYKNRVLPDDVLRYGDILSDIEYKSGGDYYRQYVILYNGRQWFLGKKNGKWISVMNVNLADARL